MRSISGNVNRGIALGGALLLVLAIAASLAPHASALKLPKDGKYKGPIGDAGKLSFRLKQGGFEDFRITLFGPPECNQPVPESWPYPLPGNAKFEVGGSIAITERGKVSSIGVALLDYGFYPPTGPGRRHIYGEMAPFTGKFTTRTKVKGTATMFTDPFVAPSSSYIDCMYFVSENWRAKRKKKR